VNFSPGQGDIVPTHALSAIRNTSLTSSGGPTRSRALVAGSPAIDAENSNKCPPPNTDQRGSPRAERYPSLVRVRNCDIGSFEFTTVPAARCNAQAGTIVGLEGNNPELRGTESAGVVQSRGGADRVVAFGGNDVACGEYR
jgi:hypothetical protein